MLQFSIHIALHFRTLHAHLNPYHKVHWNIIHYTQISSEWTLNNMSFYKYYISSVILTSESPYQSVHLESKCLHETNNNSNNNEKIKNDDCCVLSSVFSQVDLQKWVLSSPLLMLLLLLLARVKTEHHTST